MREKRGLWLKNLKRKTREKIRGTQRPLGRKNLQEPGKGEEHSTPPTSGKKGKDL